jgi:hypothetical protein
MTKRIDRVIAGKAPLWLAKVINRRKPIWTLELPEPGYAIRIRPDRRSKYGIGVFIERFLEDCLPQPKKTEGAGQA